MTRVTPAQLGIGPGQTITFPRRWGKWELVEARYLEHDNGYDVDLWDIEDHRSLIFWLFHVGGKTFGVGFYDAMHDIFRFAGEKKTVSGKDAAFNYWVSSKQ